MVAQSISFKLSGTRISVKHDNREHEKFEDYHNRKLDLNRSKFNQKLESHSLEKIYEEEFGEVLKAYNEKQIKKHPERMIKDYLKHVRGKETNKEHYSIVIELGKVEDYTPAEEIKNELPEDWKAANNDLKRYFESFKERNPNIRIENAIIHNDEKMPPHLHLTFVPIGEGYKRGLSRQPSMKKFLQNKYYSKAQNQILFKRWRDEEVHELEKLLNERGIERKLVGKNFIENQHVYNEIVDHAESVAQKKENKIQKEIDLAQKELEILDHQTTQLSNQIEELEENLSRKSQLSYRDFGFDSFDQMAESYIENTARATIGSQYVGKTFSFLEQFESFFDQLNHNVKELTLWNFIINKGIEAKKNLKTLAQSFKKSYSYLVRMKPMPEDVEKEKKRIKSKVEARYEERLRPKNVIDLDELKLKKEKEELKKDLQEKNYDRKPTEAPSLSLRDRLAQIKVKQQKHEKTLRGLKKRSNELER